MRRTTLHAAIASWGNLHRLLVTTLRLGQVGPHKREFVDIGSNMSCGVRPQRPRHFNPAAFCSSRFNRCSILAQTRLPLMLITPELSPPEGAFEANDSRILRPCRRQAPIVRTTAPELRGKNWNMRISRRGPVNMRAPAGMALSLRAATPAQRAHRPVDNIDDLAIFEPVIARPNVTSPFLWSRARRREYNLGWVRVFLR